MIALDIDILKTEKEIEDEKFEINFWRRAKFNPLKTINMLADAIIYSDPDLSSNSR